MYGIIVKHTEFKTLSNTCANALSTNVNALLSEPAPGRLVGQWRLLGAPFITQDGLVNQAFTRELLELT